MRNSHSLGIFLALIEIFILKNYIHLPDMTLRSVTLVLHSLKRHSEHHYHSYSGHFHSLELLTVKYIAKMFLAQFNGCFLSYINLSTGQYSPIVLEDINYIIKYILKDWGQQLYNPQLVIFFSKHQDPTECRDNILFLVWGIYSISNAGWRSLEMLFNFL